MIGSALLFAFYVYVFAFGGCTVLGASADVKLAWNASPTIGVTNYVLYVHTNLFNNTNFITAARLNVGTNLTATVEAITEGQWHFAVTAIKSGLESEPSNILVVEVPKPPATLRTVVVQYSGTLTNFYDVGFFRLRLP